MLVAVLPSCASRPRAPRFEVTPDAADLLAALADAPAGDRYTASLFLEFEGGFLEEDRLKINGEIALEWPDHVRVIGAYGAFKKVFDLRVDAERFEVFDHQEGVLWRGLSADPEAARSLGFAVRPADIARVLRIDGTGPLEGATVEHIETGPEALRVVFHVAGDPARWVARFERATLDLLTLSREEGPQRGLVASYEGYFGTGGRRVPRRVDVHRLDGDERVQIEVRSIRFREAIDPEIFEPLRVSDDAEIIDL